MTDEAEIHANKRTDKTYVSPRIPTIRGALRIASKVIDSEGMHFTTVKDEVLLRRTPSGRTEIIAKFLEDDRNVTVLTLQSFNGNSYLIKLIFRLLVQRCQNFWSSFEVSRVLI